MTPETEALIARVMGLDARATKGRWKSKLNHAPYKCVFIGKDDAYSTLELKPEDADLIAFYRTAAPQLATAFEAAEKRADAAEAKLKVARDILAVAYKAGKIAQIPSAHYLLEAMESALTQLEP